MSRIAALGEAHRVEGFALAGVLVVPTDPDHVHAALDALPDDVEIVVLTPTAAESLGPPGTDLPLRVVLP